MIERIRGSRVEPGVFETFGGRGPLAGVEMEHWQQEIREGPGLFFGPLVFLGEHLKQAPGPQFGNVPQIAWKK